MAKKIYFSMTTHPNMNYDRSLRSVIWEQFPKLYRLYLHYLRDHPPLKSHMQLPPQTLLSLKQCAPDVIELAQSLRAERRLRFMGTYFSESIAQCQDGMSLLDAAELGCEIASEELSAKLEGFFPQEIAYTPQLPYIINKLGVQWVLVRDWENSLRPFWVEGLDGSRCVAVPIIEREQRQCVRDDPDLLPDNALLVGHCDMEIPITIKVLHDLEVYLRDERGFETEWCFVSDYLAQVGVETVKRLTPCTNKAEDTTTSPSFSRWCSNPLSIQVHATTLAAMEARRAACLAAFGRRLEDMQTVPMPMTRPYTTWEVENPWIYPELVARFSVSERGQASPFRRMAMLIAWGSNSDARGWYPLLERRLERIDSFHETTLIANSVMRACMNKDSCPFSTPGVLTVNPHGLGTPAWHVLRTQEPIALLDTDGRDTVQFMRRAGDGWEHHARLEVPAYSVRTFRRVPLSRQPTVEQPGDSVANNDLVASFADGVLTLSPSVGPPMTLSLAPFRIYVKCLDKALRAPEPEGGWRTSVIHGTFPRLIAARQIDYHIHFRTEYTLDTDRIFADWRFWFTYPTLVDSLDDFDAGGPKVDFRPGGLCAVLTTGMPGDVWYDVPFGVVRHPNPHASFITPLTHAFLSDGSFGAALISRTGSQSFRVHAEAGQIGLCMGKSTTSGGRRKFQHWVGDAIDDFGCATEWYKEIFYGEVRHQFVVQPFVGDWRDRALPNLCRGLALGPRVLDATDICAGDARLAELEPANVRLVGLEPDTGRIVLCEMCGQETRYQLRIGELEHAGRLGPFEIAEIN